MITSPQLQALSAGLGFVQSYNNAKLAKTQGETDKTLANIQADQLLSSATIRMNQAGRQAQEDQRQGRMKESDAIAIMAAQGGGVDPIMLARIKQKADANAMTAIYEGGIAASDLKYQAAMARISGDAAKSRGDFRSGDIMLGAYSTALSNWPRSGAQSNTTPPGTPGTYRKMPKGGSAGHKGYVGGF